MTSHDVAFGRLTAPEQIPWAPHVRWALENDVLYVLDLQRSQYLSLAPKLRAQPIALARQLNKRGLLRPERDTAIGTAAKQPGKGEGGFVSFWLAALWARRMMEKRDLYRATLLLQGAHAPADSRTKDLIARFQNWRPLYPRAVVCLFDSLALGRFLWSAGVRSDLTYAVRGGPFSAHAWLEIGGAIVSDDPDYCAGFTPMQRP